jgi:hypothetical protein
MKPRSHAALASGTGWRLALVFGALGATGATGCAGGAPLLYPAKVLAKGDVRAVAGLSGEAVAGSFPTALQSALNESNTESTHTTDATYARGALVSAALNPGIAPVLSARVGVGYDFEGGLTYTGRTARVDFRHAFSFGDDKQWALSIGAGGLAALYGSPQGGTLPGVNLADLKGWGVDVPVVVGYEAASGLYMIWLGARGGWEHDQIQEVTSEPGPGFEVPPTGLSADRFWAGGVVGAATGFRHVHVAVEVDAAYEALQGSFGGVSASLSGASIVPATALWWDF